MIRITRIGHVTLSTPDPERQVAHYAGLLGLSIAAREGDTIWMACPDDHRSIALRHGEAAGCTALSLQVPAGTELRDFARQLSRQGVAAEAQSDAAPDTPQRLLLATPDGLRIEVEAERPAGRAAGEGPIIPRKLGHAAFRVTDPERTVAFFTEALGFRVSDWMGDFFAFLRCGPDHHTVNFIRSPAARLHHIAFELRDWDHVKEACDALGAQRIPLIWGPGRHTVGHNLYTYHHDPDGQIVELFAELDRMSDEAGGAWDQRPWHQETPLRPRRWEMDPFLSNAWGIGTPQGFRDA
ncbi:VOC family protein [Muricoccus aerilatus]|uniref:VOC family protein n=1 Tax=Muricoccus aerilatus TaxID=452982 RepID=UPI0005C23A35|nr:VOC family protein [Roseomonas aerilata]